MSWWGFFNVFENWQIDFQFILTGKQKTKEKRFFNKTFLWGGIFCIFFFVFEVVSKIGFIFQVI